MITNNIWTSFQIFGGKFNLRSIQVQFSPIEHRAVAVTLKISYFCVIIVSYGSWHRTQ